MNAAGYSPEDVERMKNVDIRTVVRDSFVDIRSVQIGTALPMRERLLDFRPSNRQFSRTISNE